jgi:RND family efflux transporter MFP subunit
VRLVSGSPPPRPSGELVLESESRRPERPIVRQPREDRNLTDSTPSKATSADLSGLRIDRASRVSHDEARGRAARRALALALAGGALVAVAGLVATRAGLFAPEVAATTVRLRTGSGPAAVLTANGYVVAQRKAAVASKATGRLAELFVEEGSIVKAGHVLGRLEHADYDAEVERARADYEASLARLVHDRRDSVLKRTEFDRQERLLDEGLTDQATFDRAKTEIDLASLKLHESEATVRSRRAALEYAEANQEYTKIRAPFDATVLRKNAEVGEIVAPISVGGSSSRGAIVDLADMSSLEVEVDVNEAYIARTDIGQRAVIRLDAYPDRPYDGFVRQIVPTADRQKATVVVKVAFDALDRFVLPEMGAKVTFQAKEAAGGDDPPMRAFVAKDAVVERDGRAAVVVVENGRARTLPIEVGERAEDEVEVRKGLLGGETVLLAPAARIEDGARVRVKKGA